MRLARQVAMAILAPVRRVLVHKEATRLRPIVDLLALRLRQQLSLTSQGWDLPEYSNNLLRREKLELEDLPD